MTTYKIVRMFKEYTTPSEDIDSGLTLEEARAHCNDSNTSSSTATAEWATDLTRKRGDWFDGYEEEA